VIFLRVKSCIVAIAFFVDPLTDYSPFTYEILMASLAYTFACAGISYLSNLLLSILVDMGRRRWFFTEKKI
jgi:hypothetical protein